MSEPNSPGQGSAPSVENLDAWLDHKTRDAEPGDAPAKEQSPASPAEPTVADPAIPAQPVIDWREVVLPDDVPHGFFKGKKVPDVIESYRHAEHAKQEAERERNELRQRLEQMQREREAELVARRVIAEQQQQPSQPAPDPYAEIEALWFENPKAAAERIREQARAEAQAFVREELSREREQMTQAQREQQFMAQGYEVYNSVVGEVQRRYGIDAEAAALRVESLVPYMTRPDLPYAANGGPLNAHNYLDMANKLFGPGGTPAPAAVPPIVIAPTPQLSDPPGSKRPATVTARPAEPSPLSTEKEAAMRRLAELTGVSPDNVVARMRAGGSRG